MYHWIDIDPGLCGCVCCCGSVEVDMHAKCNKILAELKAQHAAEMAHKDALFDA